MLSTFSHFPQDRPSIWTQACSSQKRPHHSALLLSCALCSLLPWEPHPSPRWRIPSSCLPDPHWPPFFSMFPSQAFPCSLQVLVQICHFLPFLPVPCCPWNPTLPSLISAWLTHGLSLKARSPTRFSDTSPGQPTGDQLLLCHVLCGPSSLFSFYRPQNHVGIIHSLASLLLYKPGPRLEHLYISRASRRVHHICVSFFVSLTKDGVIWEEETSVEKMPSIRLACWQACGALSWLMIGVWKASPL